MSGSADLREGFFQECEDLLEALADGLNAMDDGTADAEVVNAVFRTVHSIKGGAGAFGLETLVSFAHAFENVLDDVRAGTVSVSPEMLAVFYKSSDRLADLVEAANSGEENAPSQDDALIEELRQLGGGTGEDEEVSPDDFEAIGFALELPEVNDLPELEGDGKSEFEIRFTPKKELYANGNDAALLIRALKDLGELEITADLSEVPVLSEMEWDEPSVSWHLRLITDENQSDIREVFEFVEDQCALEIIRIDEGADSLPDISDFMQVQEDNPPVFLPPISPESPTVISADTRADIEGISIFGKKAEKKVTATKTTIRVDLERVDRLINIVGEMVISEAMLTQSVSEMSLQSGNQVEAAMAQLKQLSSELQESVMAIRAQPVKPLFQRMSRIVREAAQETGKAAKFETIGDTVEVDKTVIERLADPLTHMIRNAVDHGLEETEFRIAAGKPAQGTVTLSAAHRSGRVVIELSDDGAGVNRDKVRSLAIKKGLIPDDADLADTEIDNLLFLPGFSTNDVVSNMSGRGVGMDVVKSEIRALGGRVVIHSSPGSGTTVSISLPLTLAVLEGMVVQAAGETVVVPTSALRETVRADEAGVQVLGSDDLVMSSHGELVPVLDLGACLGYREMPQDFSGLTLLLIENENGRRTAVAVDQVFDQREVVIKGLETNYGFIPGIAAATILGDGRIALIVDTDQLHPVTSLHHHEVGASSKGVLNNG